MRLPKKVSPACAREGILALRTERANYFLQKSRRRELSSTGNQQGLQRARKSFRPLGEKVVCSYPVGVTVVCGFD